MAKINILSKEIFNLIAAGEVVERPSSVVKELIENSIDADSNNIIIEIINGGISEIKIVDNGKGIEKEELNKVFLPHATSKIKTKEDLEKIGTLGFRGEALASICAVSKVEVSSKPKSQELGFSLSGNGGELGTIIEKGMADGTIVKVSDLFYCVPARNKFLKKPKTEESEITNLVSRFILANPNISFKYSADGKLILQSSGRSREDAILSVYGKDILNNVLPFSHSFGKTEISGFVGKPTFSKPNRTYQTIVLNGRYINNITIQTAVTNAYGEFLMKRQYPFYCIYVKLPNSEVDVNVHPNKMEVRFSDAVNIFPKVFEAVTRTLNKLDYAPAEIDVPQKNTNNMQRVFDFSINKATSNTNYVKPAENLFDSARFQFEKSKVSETKSSQTNYLDSEQNIIDKTTGEVIQKDKRETGISESIENVFKPEQQLSTQQELNIDKSFKVIGKVFNTYLVLERENNIFFIDQHAAHERILFDRLKKQVDSKKTEIQTMLIPFILETNALEYDFITNNKELFCDLGFEIDEFGKDAFKVSSVPLILSTINLNEFFALILEDTKNQIKLSNSDLVRNKLAQTACKAAIKGGDDLSESEIKTLLTLMTDEQIPLRCPHGRPAVIKVTKTEIEKWFKRIV